MPSAPLTDVASDAKRPTSHLTPVMLNHAAWVTPDVKATAEFYTKIMGMEIASTVFDDHVPSTGENLPYFHIFFRMQDGSTLAFFEVPGIPAPSKTSHPAYDVFNHIALQAGSREEILQWHAWLTSQGVDVIGPVDHKGLILSVYFHDPSGIRLEITVPLEQDWNRHTERASEDLKLWLDCKEQAEREGRDVPTALIEMIREVRKRYD